MHINLQWDSTMKIYNKNSNCSNLGVESGIWGGNLCKSIFKPQGANPYHLLNSTSILVSQGIMPPGGTKYTLKTEGTI